MVNISEQSPGGVKPGFPGSHGDLLAYICIRVSFAISGDTTPYSNQQLQAIISWFSGWEKKNWVNSLTSSIDYQYMKQHISGVKRRGLRSTYVYWANNICFLVLSAVLFS